MMDANLVRHIATESEHSLHYRIDLSPSLPQPASNVHQVTF